MTRRWIDAKSEATALERAVLGSAKLPEIPAGAADAGWARLSAALATSAVAASTTSLAGRFRDAAAQVAPSPAVTSHTFLQGVGVGVVACVMIQAGVAWVGSSSESASPARPVVSALPQRHGSSPPVLEPSARSVEVVSASPSRSSRGARVSSSATAPLASEPARRSTLAEEAGLLRRARAELRAGDLAAAAATLELPLLTTGSQLQEEREALAIEILARSGRSEEARGRVAAFLTNFPASPHAARVQALVR